MKNLLLFLAPFFVTGALLAQDTPDYSLKDSSSLCKKQYMRQYEYENNISSFPPRKKSNWAIGVDVGVPVIHGDISSLPPKGVGASLKIRKGLTSYLSLRYQGLFSQAKGQDVKITNIDGRNVYANYRARMFDNTLQAVFTVGNVNRNKRQSKVIFNFFAGAGATTSFTQANYINENGNYYDYSGIANMETWGDRFFLKHQLKDLHDDTYETNTTPKSSDNPMIKDTRVLPTIVLGAGMDVYLSERIDLAFEYRYSRHFDDNLDGLQAGGTNDALSYLSMGFNFKIGKHQQPSYWENPVKNNYDDVAELKRNISPEYINEVVDGKFATLDSDNDGIPDYRDAEIGTPNGAEVDATGKSVDTDNDGVPNYRDEEPNSPANAQVDALGRTIKVVSENEGSLQDDINWHVFFNTSSSTLSKEYKTVLLDVAVYLISFPDKDVTLNGHADPRYKEDYNIQLSKDRANAVKNHLISLGIDASRINVNYYGDTELLVPYNGKQTTSQQVLNRRVSILVD